MKPSPVIMGATHGAGRIEGAWSATEVTLRPPARGRSCLGELPFSPSFRGVVPRRVDQKTLNAGRLSVNNPASMSALVIFLLTIPVHDLNAQIANGRDIIRRR